MRSFGVVAGLLLAAGGGILPAQMVGARADKSIPVDSPQAAYEESIRPLELARQAPQNWSEIEIAALKMARENAKAACQARSPEKFSGDDLIALARLCGFAQEWQSVYQAADNYIAGQGNVSRTKRVESSEQLAIAFDYKVQASLSLKKVDEALATAHLMLTTVPFDGFVSEATASAEEATRFSRMPAAIELLVQRQPQIIGLLRTWGPPDDRPQHSNRENYDTRSSLSIRTLYNDGLALPLLQQLANNPTAASASYEELNAALPKTIAAIDGPFIRAKRQQYELLGRHLPELHPVAFLLFPGAAAPQGLNTVFTNAAAFMLFPDWCVQCVRMGFDSTAKNMEMIADHKVRFFNLMAQAAQVETSSRSKLKDVPLSRQSAAAAQASGKKLHVDQNVNVESSADKLLEGTPTIVVPKETLADFASTDFPLIISTDHDGIIRWIQHASDGALTTEGDLDQVVEYVLRTWPPASSQ